jgi:hypothetical protein
MVTLSQDAQGQLDRYLRQVKAALRGHPAVDADEVERDVVGHIDAELSGQPEPIGASSLRAVLDRLGTPDRWVPLEDLPAWRRVLNHLHSGPDDWRLAYLTFASFVTGFWLPPFVIASVPLARATLAQLDTHDEPIGPRRWLVYPPLVLFYAALAILLIVGPVASVVVGLEELIADGRLATFVPWPAWMVAPAVVVLALGIWWVILGLLLGRMRGIVHVVFWPFADWFDRRHARRLSLIGLLLALISGASLVGAVMWR